ncbi:MAG: PorV/PorQ family protein [Calditrichaeota bacterium]|nr:PorV/PorQ family protein [Calditrichota bacterium]
MEVFEMRKLTLFLVIIFLCTLFIEPSHAGLKKLAQTGLQFLKVDVGARAAAMGGAFMMTGDDANAMFYNPAGIAFMQNNVDFFVTRTKWFADISYDAGGVVKNMGNWGSIGVSFITCDYGDFIGTRVATTEKGYVETGMLDIGAYAVGFTYAKSLTDKFTVGGQIKFAMQHLGENLLENGETIDNKVSGLAYDFGTVFYPGYKSLRLGMTVRNFSPQFKYQTTAFQLPLTFTIGFAMDVLDFMGEHQNSLLIAFDAVHPRDYTERIHVGGEYWFMDMFAIRAGYKFNYDEESLTGGVGFKSNLGGIDVKIGYSYSDFGVFDAVNRISLGITF